VKYLFDNWRQLSGKIKAGDRILLLTDYDGTLTPIASRPSGAILNNSVRRLLQSISKKRHFRVGILSGRSLSQIKGLVGLKGIIYAGNHGCEIEDGVKILLHPGTARMKPALKEIFRALKKRFAGNKQIIIENKKLSIAFHYRLLRSGEKIRQVKKSFAEITAPYLEKKKIEIMQGKKVLEVRPRAMINKGQALRWIVSRRGGTRPLVIYLGDDRTDEYAFSALGRRDISIRVGKKKKSNAGYFLRNVGEVKKFLKMLGSLNFS